MLLTPDTLPVTDISFLCASEDFADDRNEGCVKFSFVDEVDM